MRDAPQRHSACPERDCVPPERDQSQRVDEVCNSGFSKRAGAPPLILLNIRALEDAIALKSLTALSHRPLLRLAESRSGPRVCDPQQRAAACERRITRATMRDTTARHC